jgi:hypothetical protein
MCAVVGYKVQAKTRQVAGRRGGFLLAGLLLHA